MPQFANDGGATDRITLDMTDLEDALYNSEHNIQPNPDQLKRMLLWRLRKQYKYDEQKMKNVYGVIGINHIKYDIATRDQNGQKNETIQSTIQVGVGKGIAWFQKA